ncbi:TPA: hypothetical protein ACXDUQ_003334 [Clostridioides difficile]|uniref:hypothetical protein n=1 Tax=Clostridioides difficile TaxID=1496 RepID=UPI00093DA666|nr:hypothetical protein [Clostridioides difficile]EGT4846803.1 hypothetical protein [Clostridioides difficile]MCG3603533.1 hypothetical protein [Clostridioides difficile]MCI9896999.1 hypothetical protein [Clostridioides difficile]MCI9970034.1 hypothetical protein [Clostridioides difficile]MCJ0167408.1 hypothetical protein [Clostridioides difficile]
MRILELSVDEYKELENIKDLCSSKVDKYGLIIKDVKCQSNDKFINVRIRKDKVVEGMEYFKYLCETCKPIGNFKFSIFNGTVYFTIENKICEIGNI